jgi:anti-sigma regulatory factor (Ser/Thr protein kinase)
MTWRHDFARRIDVLDAVVAFTEDALAGSSLDEAARHTVHFAIEEIFSNMVKYAATGAPRITIEIDPVDGAATVTLIDSDVDFFDPTTAPDADASLPIAEREPGGLGLHLLRRLVESLSYDYDAERREGRTRFRVTGVTVSKGSSAC